MNVRLLSAISLSVCLGILLPTQASQPTPSNPEFIWARLQYHVETKPTSLKSWYTDFPSADEHIADVLNRITAVRATTALVIPSKDEIYRYPFVYTAEPEQMQLTPQEELHMREFLARGGVWMADDFHGQLEFDAVQKLVKRILPDGRWEELHQEHQIFHVVFNIPKLMQVVNDGIIACQPECELWENGPTGREPHFYAVYDKQDRLNVLLAYNNDLGDGAEWADDPAYPQEMAAFSMKVFANFVIWSMSH